VRKAVIYACYGNMAAKANSACDYHGYEPIIRAGQRSFTDTTCDGEGRGNTVCTQMSRENTRHNANVPDDNDAQ